MSSITEVPARQIRDQVERSDWFERIGRVGLAARGVVYVLLGVLAYRVATGEPAEEADKAGALELLAGQPAGSVLLGAVGLGLAAYALWRLIGAVVRRKNDFGLVKRLSWVARGLVYAAASVAAWSILRGDSSANADSEQQWTAVVLQWPGGQALVVGVGLGFVAAGVYNAYRGVSRKFEDHLDLAGLSARVCNAVRVVSVIGLMGRAVAFGAIGWFLVRAAVQFDVNEPIGLDESLRTMADATYGPWLIAGVGVGLACFGLASGIEAWRRELPD
jgi:hypothetical protein